MKVYNRNTEQILKQRTKQRNKIGFRYPKFQINLKKKKKNHDITTKRGERAYLEAPRRDKEEGWRDGGGGVWRSLLGWWRQGSTKGRERDRKWGRCDTNPVKNLTKPGFK